MCSSEGECGQAQCVAGRCVARGAVVAIATARRLLYAPVDVAYLAPGDPQTLPAIASLGRDDGALVLLRYAIALPPEVNVIEAYVVLERAVNVAVDPTPVMLHAARVRDPWASESSSWARQPRIEEMGSPVTRVVPPAGPLVRIDVRSLVQRWRRRENDEFGIAVVAEGKSVSGMAFALAPAPGTDIPVERGPTLELYVK
jgi:hypothetical protein